MRIVFTSLARREVDDAVRHYEGVQSGLGRRFKTDVGKAARRLREYPYAWSVERGNVRKCLLNTFPYKLLYSVEQDHIVVVAVAHQHRRPDYWVDR